MTTRAPLAAMAALFLVSACGQRPEPAPIVFRGSTPGAPAPGTAVAAPAPPVQVARLSDPGELTPSASGVVDYGGYSAIVARPGDTLEAIAARVGLSPAALASYNGLPADWRPDPGDELILPPREGGYTQVAAVEPAPAPAPRGDGFDLDRIAADLQEPAAAPPLPEPATVAPPAPAPQRTAAVAPEPAPAASDSARFMRPVEGEVLRPFSRASGPARNNGIDFAAEAGSPVVAAADGRVALITQPVGVDGAIVMIDHGDDLLAIYGRLEDIAVAKDQTVRRGELLGRIAPAEEATRPYLQFEVIRGTESIDPAELLS